jgi:beta-glucanase (GH16 family)
MHLETSSEGHRSSEIATSPEGQDPSAPQNFKEERAELEWVLSHPEISRSTNLVRFLSFVCNKYFNGETRDIREHAIAIEALGRKQSSFDSHVDPIVRVTARTLRKKLQALYQTDGQTHKLQIVLPVGHYIPQFLQREDVDTEWATSADAVSTEEPSLENAAGQNNPDIPVPHEAGNIEQPPANTPHGFSLNPLTAWKLVAALAAVSVIFFVGFLLGRQTSRLPQIAKEGFKWGEPVWSDEFDGTAQQLPDPAKWGYDLEEQAGIGPNERQIYCSPQPGHSKECDPRRPNAFLDGTGHLVLRAQKNSDGVWTLVRVTTKGLQNFQYGRIEARMKLPVGNGLWPSFFMVGANKDTVGWPASGSVDIAENVSVSPGSNGLGPSMIRSTMHGPRYFGSNGLWHDFKLPNGARVDDASFHTYGVIWSPGMIQFYVDDPANVYLVHDASDVPEGGAWVFDHPFYLMMNLAMGGDWAGNSDSTTPNPADMLVDYVRVYKIPPLPAPRIEWQSVPVKAGSSAASIVSLHASSYTGRVRLTCTTDVPTVPCSLAAAVLNFSDTLSLEDTLTLSTETFAEKGKVVASPGHYKVTITATTMSGAHSEITVPFEVKSSE